MISIHKVIEQGSSEGIGLVQDLAGVHRKQFAQLFSGGVKKAVCFDMGPVDNTMGLVINTAAIHLPFPVCWFESRINAVTEKSNIVRRRAALCFEQALPWADYDMLRSDVGSAADNAISVFMLEKNPGKSWMALGAGIIVAQKDGIRLFAGHDIHKRLRREMDCIATDVGIFLSLLNCTNIKRVKNHPPDKLQKKRIKNGKRPLFSYWTLHLTFKKEEKKIAGRFAGSHASPRVHLRRGHVRQYAPGKYTWIQPMVVGNRQKDVVMKDYQVRC